jgi:hypothetical protein
LAREFGVEGRTYTARSRHGAADELARQLVAAGLADRPMVIRHHGLAGTTTYRSFRTAAMWTFGRGRTNVAPRPVPTAARRGLPWQRDRAKMRFIANGQ